MSFSTMYITDIDCNIDYSVFDEFNQKYITHTMKYPEFINFNYKEYSCNVGYINKNGIEHFRDIYQKNGGLFVFMFYWAPNCMKDINSWDKLNKRVFNDLKKEPYPILCLQDGDPILFNKPFYIEMEPTNNMKKTFKRIKNNWMHILL